MVKNAWNFIIPFLGLSIFFWMRAQRLGGSVFWTSLAALFLLLTVFCIQFFRDPERKLPQDPALIVSPADGRVIAIEKVDDAHVGKAVEVRIFLNVFNVHVQRSPFTVASKVASTRYVPGKFLAASVPKASLENEQNWIRLVSDDGAKVVVKQIAGLIARRILGWVAQGDAVAPGQRVGMIQFGSQVDLVMPREWALQVKVGDKVVGAETVIARRKAAARRKP